MTIMGHSRGSRLYVNAVGFMNGLSDPLRQHGGRLSEARRLFPHAPLPWIDLSTGISPWAYPVGDIAPECWQRLPGPDVLTVLEAAAASAFGVADTAQIVAVPGSDLAIRTIAQLLNGKRAGLLTPIYSGHVAAWPTATTVTLNDSDSHDILICANPNNPDGRLIPPEHLHRFPGQLIVDEAFADAAPEASILPDRKGAIVLRSFGKFYGLAGVRLGFVIANTPVVTALRAILGDWPVSGPAIAIATRAYQDHVWQAAQRDRLSANAARLRFMLIAAGLNLIGGTCLFQLTSHDGAQSLFQILGEAGILVRPFADDPKHLRFGLPCDGQEFERLERALTDWKETQ